MGTKHKQVARAPRTNVPGSIEAFLRSPDAAGTGDSLVDRMLGCAELRIIERGNDPLYEAVYARRIARWR